jgi:hypothetical protein
MHILPLLSSAVMSGLTPGATYYYSYGSTLAGWSATGTARALDAPAAATPLHLALVADMGMTELDGSEGLGLP